MSPNPSHPSPCFPLSIRVPLWLQAVFILCFSFLWTGSVRGQNNYDIGRGMADITGQAGGAAMGGYASMDQVTTGVHDRQWARAFIVRDHQPPHRRVVHVVVDSGQMFQSVVQGVQDKIRADAELSPHYSYENIILTATHSHGGSGGMSHFALYHITVGGYFWRNYDAMVHGIYMAIKKAHRDLKPGSIKRNRGQLTNANQNRRWIAFTKNVEQQSAALSNPFGTGDRDTEMFALRFEHSGTPVALFNWFAVHPVSVSNQNTLLTSDNKGRASYLMEKEMGTLYPGYPGYDSNTSTFVAGFANSNPGDMTANRRTLEAPWPDPGTKEHGTYNRDVDFDRAHTLGGRQYNAAKALFDGTQGNLSNVTGSVDYRHAYVDMNHVPVDPPNIYPYNIPGVGFPGSATSPPWHSCRGALGVEFLAGTKDGEGLGADIIQDLVDFNNEHGDPDPSCQTPKNTIATTATVGDSSEGLTPHWLPISIQKIGDVVILAVPAEFTVTAGSRLKKTVENAFASRGITVKAIISGLANGYSGYVTTYEEYLHEGTTEGNPPENFVNGQTYEASSNHFGAFTLAAYQTKFRELALHMANGTNQPAAPQSVTMPDKVIPDHPLIIPTDGIFFFDAQPAPQQEAATNHEPAGCPPGQFWDLGTRFCWSCPTGYARTVFPVTQNDACEKPATSSFEAATRHGAGTGPIGTDCPDGQFFDLGTGACWSCPGGSDRTIFAVDGSKACERVTPAQFSPATQHGAYACEDRNPDWFYDLLTDSCWSCPLGTTRNAALLTIAPGAACDRPRHIGEATLSPAASYSRNQTVEAKFWAGHPGNVFGSLFDGLTNTLDTFVTVQRSNGDGTWTTVRTDNDWDTAIEWDNTDKLSADPRQATVRWDLAPDTPSGTYRIVHHGVRGDLTGRTNYQAISSSFQVDSLFVSSPPSTSATVTGVTHTSINIQTTVNPNGLATTYHVEYGTTPDYELGSTPETSLPALTDPTVSTVSLTGLAPGTQYHFRLVAENSLGGIKGPDQLITTGAPAVVETLPADNITQSSAQLHATVTGGNVHAWFEYGPTDTYGWDSTTTFIDATAGTTPYSATVSLFLQPGTTYHYRARVRLGGIDYFGPDRTFTTTPGGQIETLAAESVNLLTAQLNGTVIGGNGSAWFEYGTTTAYGTDSFTSSVNASTTTPFSVTITPLTAGTTYHYRARATLDGVDYFGPDRTFTTASPGVTTFEADRIGFNSVTMRGTALGISGVVWFEYGTTTAYGSITTQTPVNQPGTYFFFGHGVSGAFQPGTTYHYRAVASMGGVALYGEDKTFTIPSVQTHPAVNITPSSARVQGTVPPISRGMLVWFQYGPTDAYGWDSAVGVVDPTPTETTYAATLSNFLQPGTTYYYRAVARVDGGGTFFGPGLTFTTAPAPVLNTLPANPVGLTSAQLNGTLQGSPAPSWFEFGPTNAYGSETSPRLVDPADATAAFSENLTGTLQPGTTYHYRTRASVGGTDYFGPDQTFTTPAKTGNENTSLDIDAQGSFTLTEGRHEFRGNHSSPSDETDAWTVAIPQGFLITGIDWGYAREGSQGETRFTVNGGSVLDHTIPTGSATQYIGDTGFTDQNPTLPLGPGIYDFVITGPNQTPNSHWAVFVTVEPIPPGNENYVGDIDQYGEFVLDNGTTIFRGNHSSPDDESDAWTVTVPDGFRLKQIAWNYARDGAQGATRFTVNGGTIIDHTVPAGSAAQFFADSGFSTKNPDLPLPAGTYLFEISGPSQTPASHWAVFLTLEPEPVPNENNGGDIDQYATFIPGVGRTEFRGNHSSPDDETDAWTVRVPDGFLLTGIDWGYAREGTQEATRFTVNGGSVLDHTIPAGSATQFIVNTGYSTRNPTLPLPPGFYDFAVTGQNQTPNSHWAVFLTLEPIQAKAYTVGDLIPSGEAGTIINGAGTPLRNYRLEFSTDLINWNPLSTITANVFGNWQFTDVDAPASPKGFYRILSP